MDHLVALDRLAPATRTRMARLPRSLTIMLDRVLANADDAERACAPFRHWLDGEAGAAIGLHPTRILMQDTAGVAALVDLAALRDCVAQAGGDPAGVEPVIPIDLVIDHSVEAIHSDGADARARNEATEFARNGERYAFFRWCEQAFANLRIVPPGNGICHQINLEDLAEIAREERGLLVPEVVIGTDSHTTMVNALGILGWGVGGIEAELAAGGQALSVTLPGVVEVELAGLVPVGVTATDLALTLTRFLRDAGVVGDIVEFTGSGAAALPLPDRAAIANMAPEYGAMAGLFAVDGESLRYFRSMGRSDAQLARFEAYARQTGLWAEENAALPRAWRRRLRFDLGSVAPVMAGPARPQDIHPLHAVPASLPGSGSGNGRVMLAAITSCTNTANPILMIEAGLVARRALELGVQPPAWVKCSLAPGSRRIAELLERAGLMEPLARIGFNLVGFGCTTCVGNSGDLNPAGQELIDQFPEEVAVAVLSGNRNFPRRIHPRLGANYLASPPLVVAAAIAGTLQVDLGAEPLGHDRSGHPVHLADLWPKPGEAAALLAEVARASGPPPGARFANPPAWEAIAISGGPRFEWDAQSLRIRRPTFYDRPAGNALGDIADAHPLLWLGDDVTTDHISPLGKIAEGSSAAAYLRDHGWDAAALPGYGEMRGNHEVMQRGGFAHAALGNRLCPDTGSMALDPQGQPRPVFDAAAAWRRRGRPLVVLAGRNYGAGSARDWAAKATAMLGIRAVIAQGFERIHRANLVSLGILPVVCRELPFCADVVRVDLAGVGTAGPQQVILHSADGSTQRIEAELAITGEHEREMLASGGIFSRIRQAALTASARTDPG
ncbi:MAG: aconitate hydratase AcnA [Sphingomonadales bacterium]|nr:aconitate hydratase AcnA [Sphingomonadales bacterium]MBD3772614.1 aconitate hydratase AcnA [Paracoccaceae bacterium]